MASARAALTAILCLVVPLAAQAQQPAPAAPAPPLLPMVANPLQGKALVDALRKGGYVLFMRHARQGGPQQPDVCDHKNLAPEGEAQARKVGAALRDLGIPIATVRSSPICRARETATLLALRPVELDDDLKPAAGPTPLHAARKRLIAQAPPAGANVLFVSHGHSSAVEEEKVEYDHAEILVYRPDGRGDAQPVARIKLEDWDKLVAFK